VELLISGINLFWIFLFTTVFLFIARRVAKKIGLVDRPNFRKRHRGMIPLAGGISVYAGVCVAFAIIDYSIPHTALYLFCAGIMVLVGALDDRFDISVKLRLIVQGGIAATMILVGDLRLLSLGHIIGEWEVKLGYLEFVVTLLAVWGAINAFNMVDGIDGLLGGLSCVSFAAIGLTMMMDGQIGMAMWCFAMMVAIMPYIMLNLGVLGRRYKVFMGDAGSTLIGFTIVWMLIVATQGKHHPMHPVTALWFIAIPLMDMVAIMYRRISKGMSPFSPDRQHLHHLMMRSGFTPRQSLVLITLTAALLAAIGMIGEFISFIPEWGMLILFLIMFTFYGYCIKHAWKMARAVKRWKRRIQKGRTLIS